MGTKRKYRVFSGMSDEELAALLEKERKEHPEDFSSLVRSTANPIRYDQYKYLKFSVKSQRKREN